ncbi:MAG: SurA N-terminal domain-containing protein [Tsuneonella sp.]
MLQFFRNIFKSRFGVGITLAFLVLIGLAFAVGDVAGNSTFGGIAGGDTVARVGDSKIGSADFSRTMSLSLDQVRQQDPTLTMASFIEQGGLKEVLDQMIDRQAIAEFGRKYGLRAGTNLVNSEIHQIPAFQGPDGKFSETAFRGVLAQRKIGEAAVREDLADGLFAKQVLVPAAFGAKLPAKVVMRYAALAKERRQGAIGLIPSAAFAPKGDPSASQLAAFYQQHQANYIRPERRVIRYATFDASALGTKIDPTDAEIAAQYNKDKALYAAKEERTLSQLIVPTQQAAEAIRKRVAAGGSLASAAHEAGLEVATVGPVDKPTYAGRTSQAVADAAFAAARGAIAPATRGGLGWYVVHVDAVNNVPARSLAQVSGEIAKTLREQKVRSGLTELAGNVEDEFESGTSLGDVAKSLNVTLQDSKPITANGQVYGAQGETAPPVLAPALQSAFEMDEGQPQIAEVEAGKTFLIYEASQITPSAAAPLRERRQAVTEAWRRSEGAKQAKAAADRILARVAKGQTLAAAVAAEKQPLPAPEAVNLTREQLLQTQRVPPPLALLFSMAQGTAKKLQGQQDLGWFVVSLAQIEPGKVAPGDPVLAQAAQALNGTAGREYSEELRAAMRKELGVERNQNAIDAVRKQLTGAGNTEN